MRERVEEWLVDGPAWQKALCGVVAIASGAGVFVLCGRLGFTEGGKLAGLFIGFGLALLMLWANA